MIRDGGNERELARLSPADPSDQESGRFTIQRLVTPRHLTEFDWLESVKFSLDLLLVTWRELCYHTTTTSNVDSAERGGVYWRLGDERA